jgi:phosphoglycerate dehydrogenase-like enzyme
LIDEDALVEALREGWIAGAMLDVYTNEFQKPPREDFWELTNLILTPHASGGTDIPTNELAELFYENLTRFVDGRELLNVIDWDRGY